MPWWKRFTRPGKRPTPYQSDPPVKLELENYLDQASTLSRPLSSPSVTGSSALSDIDTELYDKTIGQIRSILKNKDVPY